MNESETAETMKEGLEILCLWSRNIAMLPLENWLAAFERAETIAPFIDPTLYREYLESGKGEIMKALIRAAIPLKKAVLAMQPKVKEIIGTSGSGSV